jgi:hypothetical protein
LVTAWGLRDTGELTEATALVDTTILLPKVAMDPLAPLADLPLSSENRRARSDS